MTKAAGPAWKDRLYMQSSSSIPEVRDNAKAILAELGRLERELSARSAITPTSGATPDCTALENSIDSNDVRAWRTLAYRLERDRDMWLADDVKQNNALGRVIAERDQLKRALNRQIELNTPEAAQSATASPRVGLPLLYNLVCLWAQPKDEQWMKDMAELMREADRVLSENGYEVSPYTTNEHQVAADSRRADSVAPPIPAQCKLLHCTRRAVKDGLCSVHATDSRSDK